MGDDTEASEHKNMFLCSSCVIFLFFSSSILNTLATLRFFATLHHIMRFLVDNNVVDSCLRLDDFQTSYVELNFFQLILLPSAKQRNEI